MDKIIPGWRSLSWWNAWRQGLDNQNVDHIFFSTLEYATAVYIPCKCREGSSLIYVQCLFFCPHYGKDEEARYRVLIIQGGNKWNWWTTEKTYHIDHLWRKRVWNVLVANRLADVYVPDDEYRITSRFNINIEYNTFIEVFVKILLTITHYSVARQICVGA